MIAKNDTPLDHLLITGATSHHKPTIKLNGYCVAIPMRLFEMLIRLAWNGLNNQPWLHRSNLGPPRPYSHQYVSALRKIIAPYQLDQIKSLIQSDGRGNVRLNLPPESIQMYSHTLMRKYPSLRLPEIQMAEDLHRLEPIGRNARLI
jgi:hypothetical protein